MRHKKGQRRDYPFGLSLDLFHFACEGQTG
jgi:hypothetical protein